MKINETLLSFYLGEFQRLGEPALVSICKCAVPSKVVLEKYKELDPIEKMSETEKAEMKKYVNGLFPAESADFRLKACKIIYTIGTVIS
jgi:hypothetical protein